MICNYDPLGVWFFYIMFTAWGWSHKRLIESSYLSIKPFWELIHHILNWLTFHPHRRSISGTLCVLNPMIAPYVDASIDYCVGSLPDIAPPTWITRVCLAYPLIYVMLSSPQTVFNLRQVLVKGCGSSVRTPYTKTSKQPKLACYRHYTNGEAPIEVAL